MTKGIDEPWDHQEVLVRLLRAWQAPIVAEVGVASGRTSEYLLRNVPGLLLYMVDQWKCPASGTRKTQEHYDAAMTEATQRTNFCAYLDNLFVHPRVHRIIIRKPSVEAATQFPEQHFDLVFIDACHKYESVLEDCRAWWPKIRKFAVLCGHDYFSPRNGNGWGVKQAVDEFAKQVGLPVEFDKTVWVIRKPE